MDPNQVRELMDLPPEEQRRRILEANAKLHDHFASAYDTEHPQQLHPHYQKRLFDDLHEACAFLARDRPLSDVSVLDLGSGTGFIPIRLRTIAPFPLTCVDMSEPMLQGLRDKLGAGGTNLRVFAREIVEFCENDTDTYDFITISALLHHVYDVAEVMRAAVKRARPRAVIYVAWEPLKGAKMDPSVYRVHCLLRELDNLLVMQRRAVSGGQYDDVTIADFHTLKGGVDPEQVIGPLRDATFEVRVDPFYARQDENLSWLGGSVLGARNTFSVMAKRG